MLLQSSLFYFEKTNGRVSLRGQANIRLKALCEMFISAKMLFGGQRLTHFNALFLYAGIWQAMTILLIPYLVDLYAQPGGYIYPAR